MSTTIIGNLTDEPKIKFTTSGLPVVNFSIAVSRKKQNDEEYTSYFDVQAWGTLAQNIADSLHKGTRVFATGSLTQDRFEKDGQKRSAVILVAESVGPDLRWASASVSKNEKGGNFAKPRVEKELEPF